MQDLFGRVDSVPRLLAPVSHLRERVEQYGLSSLHPQERLTLLLSYIVRPSERGC